MKEVIGPRISQGQSFRFELDGEVRLGEPFIAPTVIVTPVGAGAVTLDAPVEGDSTATGTPFYVAGVFKPSVGFIGPVALSATVQGKSQDAMLYVMVDDLTGAMVFNAKKFSVE